MSEFLLLTVIHVGENLTNILHKLSTWSSALLLLATAAATATATALVLVIVLNRLQKTSRFINKYQPKIFHFYWARHPVIRHINAVVWNLVASTNLFVQGGVYCSE